MELVQTDLLDFFYINREENMTIPAPCSSLSYIAIDTESYPLIDEYGSKATGLDPFTSRVRLISIHIDGITYVIDCMYVDPSEFLKSISKYTVIAHNAAHDIKAIKASFNIDMLLRCTHTALCTLAVSTGWRAALMRGKSLDDMARDFFSIHMDKRLSLSDWSKPKLSKEQLLYSALDVAAPKSSDISSVLIEAFILVEKTCKDLGQEEVFYLDQDMVPIIADMAMNGLPMNKELLSLSVKELTPSINKATLFLCKNLSIPIEERLCFLSGKAKKEIHIPEQSAKLLNNNRDLVKLVNQKLKTSDQGMTDLQADTLLSYIKSIEAEDLEETEDESLNSKETAISYDVDLLKQLLEYKKLSKLRSEMEKYISNLNVVTGCLHTNTNVVGTSTARMSSSGGEGLARVNIQQISTIPFSVSYSEDSQLFDL